MLSHVFFFFYFSRCSCATFNIWFESFEGEGPLSTTGRRPTKETGLEEVAVGAGKARQPSKPYPLFASSLQNTNGIGFPMAASTTSHGAAARRRWPGRSRAELPHRPPLPSTAAEAPLLAPGCPPQRRGLARSQTRALMRADHVTVPHL